MLNSIKVLKKKLGNSKDGKALASNFSYLIVMQIANYIFPLLTIPYLARVVGVEGIGKIAFAAAIIIWFQTITDWGFSYTATRDVARNRNNLEKISEIFSNVLWSKILLATISFILILIITEFIPYLKECQILLLITFMLVPAKILLADWFFQAMEKMKFITIFDLISKAIVTICIFLFIKNESNYMLQPLFLSFFSLVTGFFSFFLILYKFNISISVPRFRDILDYLNKSKDVFINNIFPNLYNSFSTVLLGFTSGVASNGILDAGTKFNNIAQQFIGIVSRVFFPFLSRKSDKHSILVKINLSISFLASIFLFFCAPYIIKFFYTENFYSAIEVLQIVALSLFFLSLSNTYGLNYLIIHGFEKDLRNIMVRSSIIGFLISFPLIYYYDFIGAAITITLTRVLIGSSVFLKARLIKRVLENENSNSP